LSELRAVEALDLIVGHLDHKGLFSSFSLNMRPMVDAVVGFGEAAVPYLEKALSGDRILVRKEACVALANIGGARAQKVLEKALQNESDEAVIKSIRGGLSEIAIRRQQRRSR
jgi:HEAT repeat protein